MFENEAMETMKREADSLLESNEKPVTKNTEDTFSMIVPICVIKLKYRLKILKKI